MINKDSVDTSTTVSIEYSNLPRDSLHHLEQHLRDWVTWHKKSSPIVVSEHLSEICSGSLQYCPELAGHVGGKGTGLAYADKPSKPHHLPSDRSFNVQYERVGGVPKYDHVTEMSLDGSMEAAQPAGRRAQKSAGTTPWRQSRRCFNCGSFLHSLRVGCIALCQAVQDCPETRDAGAIAQARRESQQGRVSLGNERYFTAAPEEFADLQPGMLSAELRAALGDLGSADPPPWLHRMRALGYPPGYMAPEPGPGNHDGLVLLDDTAEPRDNAWDSERDDAGPNSYSGHIEGAVDPALRQRVAIPGVNAPVPKDADLEKWSYRPSELSAKSGQTSPRKRRQMHPPCHSSSAPPQYAPQCVPSVQAWTPQPPPGLYPASSDPWMQQGYVTPPPAYPGGRPWSVPYYAPSLQPGSMPDPYSQSSTLGHPEYQAATPTLPTIQQYGQAPQLFGGSYYHGGMHVHPVHDRAATAYSQAGAYGFPNSADAGMLQERYMNGYGNGHVSPGPVSILRGVSAAGMLEQEVLPPPPLLPESGEYTPPPPPPLDAGS